ncbi:hypothetical protein CARUB_v10025019mg [Capsella rubella]|uniref:RING-type domain-containing protein n=1 Tax=Capsella rubella TaxID=81985 RepID=R0G053_9BRAS|nr:RING-H2 finger protein ATL64 [Capsella rubella]EOA28787.1 hypothetical protein CARUB_v10025019mg [Capsella rubella]
METKSVDVDVHVTAWHHTPSSEFSSNVLISTDREFEELIIDKNDDSVTRFRSYPDPSPPAPIIYLKIQNFEQNHIYRVVLSQLHNRVLSKLISEKIVVKTQQLRSQSSESLYVVVYITLTQKVYIVVPRLQESEEEEEEEEEGEGETETCAICLEKMLEFEHIYDMTNCSHQFHKECVIEWMNRQKNSCPLCRQPVYQLQE